MIESHKSGTLSILTNGRVNQERENSMKSMDSTLKDHSMYNLLLDNTDTSKLSTAETWSSRQRTVKRLRSGGSTNNHTPSRPSSTTNHGISNPLVRLTRCKSIAPTHNGSRSSSSKLDNSSMLTETPEFLMSIKPEMRKLERLLSARTQDKSARNGMSSMSIKLERMRLRE